MNNIICRYGVQHELIRDEGSHFKKKVVSLLEKHKIQHHKSHPCQPQTNGAIKAANENMQRITEKMAKNNKGWPDKLPFVIDGTLINIVGLLIYFGVIFVSYCII